MPGPVEFMWGVLTTPSSGFTDFAWQDAGIQVKKADSDVADSLGVLKTRRKHNFELTGKITAVVPAAAAELVKVGSILTLTGIAVTVTGTGNAITEAGLTIGGTGTLAVEVADLDVAEKNKEHVTMTINIYRNISAAYPTAAA